MILRANEVAVEDDRDLGKLEKLNAALVHTQLMLAQERRTTRDPGTAERPCANDVDGSPGRTSSSCPPRRRHRSDRPLEYVNVIATNDVDLATDVENMKNVLGEEGEELESS